MLLTTITTDEKDAAIALRDVQPSASLSSGKYEQIHAHEVSPGVWVGRDEYVGPSGVGYVKFCEIRKGGTIHMNRVHAGTETYRNAENDVWQEVTENGV